MKTVLSSLQWVIFHIGVVISMPIIVGSGLQLEPAQVENLMGLTLILTGAGSLLQNLIGHKSMLMEGPAGPWWAAYLVIATVSLSSGMGIEEIRTNIQGALIISGLVIVLVGMLGVIRKVQNLFTPRVTGIFLMLIAIQVSGLAVEKMVSSGFSLFVLSLGVLGLSMLLLNFTGGLLRRAAILLSVIIGWLAALIFGLTSQPDLPPSSLLRLPELFPWGTPSFDLGTVLTLVILGQLQITNQIGSIRAMEAAQGEQIPIRRYDRGLTATGITSALAGVFGGSGTTPFAVSAGLVSITGERSKTPFLLGSLIFIILGIVGPLGRMLSTIPAPVAGAVLLISVASLMVIGMRSVASMSFEGSNTFIVGLGLLSGTGCMFIPSEFWPEVPSIVAGIFSNGVIIGTLIALVLEHIVLRDTERDTQTKD